MTKFKYIFYRILGNDLPPRHRKGQTLANLKVILEQESVFEGLEKRWIINKIVDPLTKKKIIGLFKKYRQKYQVISFDRKEFKKIPKEDFNKRLAALIGLNDARNLALREGKKLARWVLVFDGNCFFTQQAWKEVSRACLMKGDIKYIIVPMMRLGRLGKGNISEPQVIFRHNSREEFDVKFGYGRDSKVELLKRLGVYAGLGLFTMAGHVVRLPSGNEVAESDILERKKARDRGIRVLMNKMMS